MAEASEIQIVIPMSGSGERFRRAGYRVPKPLISVEERPIIAHVLDLFPGARDVIFICNQEHLDTSEFRLKDTLESLCPEGRIVGIMPHKLGPVYAISQCYAALDPERPVMVSYCDYGCVWDYQGFLEHVAGSGCEGCIPCYRGFHPHMLRTTSYAYVLERGGRALEIREKASFTEHPQTEWASMGAYYFASGALLRRAFDETMRRMLTVGGEYYVSLAYRPLLEWGHHVTVFEVPHFMQWGAPEDLAEYVYFSDTFRALAAKHPPRARQRGTVLIPAAGQGDRFARAGFEGSKPLIPVSGRPMLMAAARDLPQPDRHHIVLRKDQPDLDAICASLGEIGPTVSTTVLDGPTDGQLRSCLLALGDLDPDVPLTIGACDSGAIYDPRALERLLADPSVDVILWTARGYPGAARRPMQYGWVREENGRALGVAVKEPPLNPAADPVLVGTFTFRRTRDFERAASRLVARDGRVNGELYVDSAVEDCLELGLSCVCFEVERYLCWGTPDDLRTFEYWQSCFHIWPGHPYRREGDPRFGLGSSSWEQANGEPGA